MPRTTQTIAQKLAHDKALLEWVTVQISQFNEVTREHLYRTYWPEYADREAPRLLQNLKNRRYRLTQRIHEYEMMIQTM